MKPKDALGELVKEWRKDFKNHDYNITHSLAKRECANKLEKVREGKVLVDKAVIDNLLTLNVREMEGISMPEPEEWMKAFESLRNTQQRNQPHE